MKLKMYLYTVNSKQSYKTTKVCKITEHCDVEHIHTENTPEFMTETNKPKFDSYSYNFLICLFQKLKKKKSQGANNITIMLLNFRQLLLGENSPSGLQKLQKFIH